ncbi:ATP-binding cassette domain-containing protein [Streptomyces sp. NBC_00322]|uniref:peptidase domain-containing ABC transporter n=1 Tax=Streptomyces sp. NBC_00322 TaxID=2975712 RepID=UPI002E289E35|nr:ATP-binding cassette domain-containing protein [Streptomyces sp. NBC_00322]
MPEAPFLRRAVARPVRTRHVRQVEEADCGASCLSVVLAWFGRHASWRELQQVCGGGRDGVTAATLIRAASHYGLAGSGKRIRLSGDDQADTRSMRSLAAPAILFVGGNHFVVLDHVSERGTVSLNDPAIGHRLMPMAEFRAFFSGIALVFTPTEDFHPAGVPHRLRGDLLSWARPRLGLLAGSVLAGTSAALVAVATALLMRAVVTATARPDSAGAAGTAGGGVLLWALGSAAVAALTATWIQTRLQSALLRGLSVDNSRFFVRTLLDLPASFFQRRFTGGVAARVQIADTIANQLAGTVVPVFVGGVSMTVVLGVLAWFAPGIAVLVLCGVGCSTAILRRASTGEASRQGRLLAEQASRDGEMISGLNMLETLKAEAATTVLLDRWEQSHARSLAVAHRSMRSAQRTLGTAGVVDSLVSVAAVLWAAADVRRGAMALPDLMSVITLVGVFQASAGAVTRGGLSFGQLRAAFAAFADVAGSSPETAGSVQALRSAESAEAVKAGAPLVPPATTATTPTPSGVGATPGSAGRLQLRTLEFGYDINRPPLVRGVDVRVPPGSRLVVVGTTGSGKSTLARLVVGSTAPWAGSVTLDGIPVTDLPPGSVGYVSQHPVLFEGSVAENVAFGDDEFAPDLIDQALATACLDRVVARRGGPRDARVEPNGQNFSGGERQRLALARALCRQPALLVLDEATSALEGPLEARIDANLRRLGTTTVVVTHRLGTVGPDDLVLVLHRGTPAQLGTHRDLSARQGQYRELLGASR